MKLPRFIHHAWAVFFGYYWLPCPLCGKYIGGHEYSWKKSGVLKSSEDIGEITCYECKEEATRLNKLKGFTDS